MSRTIQDVECEIRETEERLKALRSERLTLRWNAGFLEYLCPEKNGVFDAQCGTIIFDVIDEAVRLAKKENRMITFKFSGATVAVSRDSDKQLVAREWELKRTQVRST